MLTFGNALKLRRGGTWISGGGGEAPSRSLDFNGTDAYTLAPDHAALDITTNLTLEADCKPDAVNGARTLINRFQGGADGYILRIDNGKLSLYVRISNSFFGVTGASDIPTGAWVHLAGVYDGSNLRVFINGVQDGITARTGSIGTGSAPLRVGGSLAGEHFDGRIATARVWSVDRSSDLGVEIDGSEAGLVTAYGVGSITPALTWADVGPNGLDARLFGAIASTDVP